jgi:hypothetical protein
MPGAVYTQPYFSNYTPEMEEIQRLSGKLVPVTLARWWAVDDLLPLYHFGRLPNRPANSTMKNYPSTDQLP